MIDENKIVAEEEPVKKKSKLSIFMKKNGFYLGMFVIILLVIMVLGSDKDDTYKGSVTYNDKIVYVDTNKLYVKTDDEDAKLLTANLMTEYNSTQVSKILLMCKISEDQKILYYFDNVYVDGDSFLGDLNVYKNNKSKLISKNVDLSYALASNLETLVFAKATKDTETDILVYDLYLYENGKETLIDEDVDSMCFTLSGDGKVVYYNKGFYSDTFTTTMYMYKDGVSKKINNQAVYFYKGNANGSYVSNWPMTNEDGTKVLYTSYAGENALPSLNIYQSDSDVSTMLSENFVQVFADKELNHAVVNGDTNAMAYTGDFLEFDLNTMEKEVVAENIWALIHLDVARYVDSSFFDFNFYFKSYDEITSTASLCFIDADKTEQIVLPSVYTDDVQITDDYKTLYALGYYYSAEGGQLTIYSDISTSSFKETIIDEGVLEYHIDDNDTVLGYRKDVKLYLIDKKGNKKMIDNHDVTAFEVTSDGNLIYFYKEGEIGSGELYVMETDIDKDYVLVDKDTTYVYEFGNNYIAYITAFEFGSESGRLVVTDGEENYEVIAEKASNLLMKNYIK